MVQRTRNTVRESLGHVATIGYDSQMRMAEFDDQSAFYVLEVLRGRLQSIVDEAGTALLRTAFSNGVREAHDFACAVMTSDGHTVVQSQQSIPAFIGTMTHTWRAMKQHYPAFENLKSGDVLATNDPWWGTGQLNDITIIEPIFDDEALIGFAGVVAHHTDVGGRGHVGAGTQVFEEGFRLPVLKLATATGIDSTVVEIISANVRLPNELLGDLSAMLNASAVMNRQLAILTREVGGEQMRRLCDELEMRSERYMRRVITALPDGQYQASMESRRDMTAPFSIQLTLTVAGDQILMDFAGSSDQVDEGINSCYSYSYAYAMYGCKCLLAPDLPFNDGLLRPVTFQAPEGSVVHCRFPAASSGRSTVGHHLPGLIFQALVDAMPAASIAQCGAPPPALSLRGSDARRNAMFAASLYGGGGFGARARKDGPSALTFPTNVQTVSIEMMETYNPILFVEKELVCDSGGAGQFRGGLGQRIAFKLLANRAEVYVRAQWLSRSPKGVKGGRPGGQAAVELNGKKLSKLTRALSLQMDDVVAWQSPGGGGYGSPTLRDRSAIEADVRGGYVSLTAADRIYARTT
jgi:N-methylhydantoinase B